MVSAITNVIERPLDSGQRRRIFRVAQDEMQMGIQRVGLGNGCSAEIDADAVGRLQRSEQSSIAAAQFQHPLSRWDQEPHEFLVALAISGVELAAAILFSGMGFELVE
jgi:hypothetical protein